MFAPVQHMKAMALIKVRKLSKHRMFNKLHYRLRSIQRSFGAPADGLLLGGVAEVATSVSRLGFKVLDQIYYVLI